MEAVDRAITYLYDTRTLAIEYGPDQDQKSEVFTCASNTAFADNEDRKSSDAYLSIRLPIEFPFPHFSRHPMVLLLIGDLKYVVCSFLKDRKSVV